MRKRAAWHIGLAAALLLLVVFSGIVIYRHSQETRIHIGNETFFGCAPFYIAEEKGFFKNNGIRVELVPVDNDPDSEHESAYTSGKLQGLALPVDRAVQVSNNSVDWGKGSAGNNSTDWGKLVLLLDSSNGADGIVADQKIKDVADLKGATVAVDKSSPGYLLLLALLDKSGLKESEVKIKNMNPDAAGHAYLTGQVEAAVVWESGLTLAGNRPGGHILATSADCRGLLVDGLLLNSNFYRNQPEAAAALIRSWYQAVDYWRKHPAEGNRIVADQMEIGVKMVPYFTKGIVFLGREENIKLFNANNRGNIDRLIRQINRLWLEAGRIKASVDSADLIKADIVTKAARD